MDNPKTFSIQFVNDGRPFSVSQGNITPDLHSRALTAKRHALKAAYSGLGDVPEGPLRDELAGDGRQEATIAMTNALLHGVLARIDPKIAPLKPEEVQQRLTLGEYVALCNAIGQATNDSVSEVRPLVNTTTPTRSS